MRNIHSSDPRKKLIVKALKDKSGGTKVTLVKETGPGVFEGTCHKPELVKHTQGFVLKTGNYTNLGVFTVTQQELGWNS